MIRELRGHKPRIHPSAYVHETAEVIGKVTIEKDASIWPNVVIRGDVEEIHIGEGTNIQDNTVIHTDVGAPTIVGKYISVGHSVTLHGCTIRDNCLIGMGSIILDGVIVEEESLVGAAALVSPGKIIPRGSLVIGVPAKVKRALTGDEVEKFKKNALEYIALAETYRRTERKISEE